MARIVTGPYVSGEVTSKQTGAPLAAVTVTVNHTVYTDPEMTAAVTTVTTNGSGIFSFYAPPGLYTFTVSDTNAVPLESVEVLSGDQGNSPSTGGGGAGVVTAWAPSTPYLAGQLVTFSGITYAAKANHTSGGSFTSANWNQVAVPAGGTTGQVLAKQSGADGDFTWTPTAAVDHSTTPLADSGSGTPGTSANASAVDHVHPSSGGGSSTVLGAANRIYVPANLVAGTSQLAMPNWPAVAAGNVKKAQQNFVPVTFTRSFTGVIGWFITAAGSSDAVMNAGVWNPHATYGRPGTNFFTFSNAVGVGTGYTWDTTTHSFAAGQTYWIVLWCTGTTAPQATNHWPQEKLVVEQSTGWTDNNPSGTSSWRYATPTTGDLTATGPTTGDIGILPTPLFRAA